MIPVQGVKGLTVLILGMARSGLVAAQASFAGGAKVLCWDDDEDGRERALENGFKCVDPMRGGLEGIDLLITSPGIPHLYPEPHVAIAEAIRLGIPIDNDIGLFFRSFATNSWQDFDKTPKIIAVTGSNGKSTTSALIHHLLKVAGKQSQIGGNIGRGALDLEPAEDGGVVVLELSSYQTELARSLTPDIAVFTNLSQDHLDRHAGYGGYFAAKRRLFAEGSPDYAIIGVDEVEGQYLASQFADTVNDECVIRVASRQKLKGNGWQVTSKKGFLSERRKGRQVASIDLRNVQSLAGEHNHQNACSAYAVLRSLNVSPRIIEEGLGSFLGLAHRGQLVREINGVQFVNDSKATNVDATAKALGTFKNIRWICGGLQKEGDFLALKSKMQTVIKAYVIGQEAKKFALQLEVESEICTTMAAAVNRAFSESVDGDIILLAPAAASFDQYDNFEARGDDFIAQVSALTATLALK